MPAGRKKKVVCRREQQISIPERYRAPEGGGQWGDHPPHGGPHVGRACGKEAGDTNAYSI